MREDPVNLRSVNSDRTRVVTARMKRLGRCLRVVRGRGFSVMKFFACDRELYNGPAAEPELKAA